MYKGKAYIKECIQSIANQTYPSIELILMDDGSPDDTYSFTKALLAEFGNLDSAIYCHENSGVAATRNACIGYASGDYVAFMDQDDRIEPDYIEKLMSYANELDSDIVLCGYVRMNDDGKVLKRVELCNDPFSKYRIVAPWARIYRRAFLIDNSLEFLTTSCGEDTYLTIQAYALTDKISIVEKYAGYIWRFNPSSVSNTKQKSVNTAIDACKTYEKIIAKLPENRFSDTADEEYFFIRGCIFYLLFSSYAESSKDAMTAYDKYFSFLDKNFPKYMKNKNIGFFRPRCESFSVRATVKFFLLLKRVKLARLFYKLWSKIQSQKAKKAVKTSEAA